MRPPIIPLFCAILLYCNAAFAEDHGLFINASAGHVTVKSISPNNAPGVHEDNTSTSWALGGGYRFNQYVGIEAGYRDFERREIGQDFTFIDVMLHITRSGANIPLNFGTVSGHSKNTADITAWTVGGFAAYPLTQSVDVTARAGWYRWRSKWSANSTTSWSDGVTVGSEVISASGTNNGTQPYCGAGLSYSFTKAAALSMNWTRFKSASSNTNDAEVFDVGMSFRF